MLLEPQPPLHRYVYMLSNGGDMAQHRSTKGRWVAWVAQHRVPRGDPRLHECGYMLACGGIWCNAVALVARGYVHVGM